MKRTGAAAGIAEASLLVAAGSVLLDARMPRESLTRSVGRDPCRPVPVS
jgi:hypothetical protein